MCRVFAAHGSGSEMNIVNNEGMTVLTLKSKSFSVHNKWYIFSGSSTDKADKIATVKPEEGSQTAQVQLKPMSACSLICTAHECITTHFYPTE